LTKIAAGVAAVGPPHRLERNPMRSALRDVAVPAFGVPLEAPRIPPATYERRCREAYAGAGCGWLIVWLAAERLLART